MSRPPVGPAARLTAWYLRRNPTYLLSATMMAIGMKLYLFDPDAPAGTIGYALLTLGLLQLYEAAVATALIALHRARRSPEDWPSLMLVAAVFWTGPLAATLELTGQDGPLGLGFTAAACTLALAELALVRRAIGLRMSPAASLVGVLVVLLVGAAPSGLRVPYGQAGTNTLALYACWWALALAAVFAIPAARWHARHGAGPRPEAAYALRFEAAFLVLVLLAGGAHLNAMNYAFLGHARAFYVAPALAALAAATFEFVAAARLRSRRVVLAIALLPLAGICLSLDRFDPEVPAERLPALLRDPLGAALLLAGLAWWYGAARHRSAALLHGGSLALAWLLVRAMPATAPAPVTGGGDVPPLPMAWGGYALAAYLVVIGVCRRSRIELFLALPAQLIATGVLVWGRHPAAGFIFLLDAGWSWFGAAHIAPRPSLAGRAWAVGLLVLASCAYDGNAAVQWAARGHALALSALLIVVGCRWPGQRYRELGAAAVAAWLAFLVSRHGLTGPRAGAASAVAAAFVLLLAGVVISWRKRDWLRAASAAEAEAAAPAAESGGEDSAA